MGNFIQLHILTSYPPANLNRDDLGRPKTAIMGGVQRLRISSQSLKRAWRTSETMPLKGIRTKELGIKIKNAILSGKSISELMETDKKLEFDEKINEKKAKEWAWMIVSVFVDKKTAGSEDEEDKKDKKGNKKEKKTNVNKETLKTEQLVFYSLAEVDKIDALIKNLREKKNAPSKEELDELLINNAGRSADLAMFGRMLSSKPEYNVEAAVQVAHAITVHKVAVEDDYFTAVDDLNKGEEDMGAAHIGEAGFAAGLFYLYVCLDRNLLVENLTNDEVLAKKTIRALTKAAVTIAPSGKQNSYASRAYASYVLAEKGDRQPRSLSVAFLAPVKGDNMLDEAIKRLEATRNKMDGVYFGWIEKKSGKKDEKGHDEIIKEAKSLPSRCINTASGEGELDALLKFVED